MEIIRIDDSMTVEEVVKLMKENDMHLESNLPLQWVLVSNRGKNGLDR
jgi:hypothetical protein